MNKKSIPVSGMHCGACETLLEKTLSKIKGVAAVSASRSKGTLEISYGNVAPDWSAVESSIKECGYALGESEKKPWFSRDAEDYEWVFASLLAILAAIVVFRSLGIEWSMGNLASPTLPVVFAVGLAAGLSTCMALVWGLVLGVSAKWNASRPNASAWSRFEPHLYFNAGRVLGFAILGGILGSFGSLLGFSHLLTGALTLAVAAVMILLGANLTGISPRLGSYLPSLPKFFDAPSDSATPGTVKTAFLWASTFFLPCGFTLAMQTYAISTGNFVLGAATMGIFALGTTPGLLGVGGITAFAKGAFAKRFFQFVGTLVFLLWLYNLSNAHSLVSLGGGYEKTETVTVDPSTLEIQEVRMVQDSFGYSPKTIPIKPNRRIRLVVEGKDPYSCASRLVIPSVGVSKALKKGENVIEFVSPTSGTVRFSCSMGMYTGKFVVEE